MLNIVPSLDTPTCAISTRKFNEAAGKLDNTVVVVLDENNKVLHSELVPEIKQEPNYDAALATLK